MIANLLKIYDNISEWATPLPPGVSYYAEEKPNALKAIVGKNGLELLKLEPEDWHRHWIWSVPSAKAVFPRLNIKIKTNRKKSVATLQCNLRAARNVVSSIDHPGIEPMVRFFKTVEEIGMEKFCDVVHDSVQRYFEDHNAKIKDTRVHFELSDSSMQSPAVLEALATLRSESTGETDMFGNGGSLVEKSFAECIVPIGRFYMFSRNKNYPWATRYGMSGSETFPMRSETAEKVVTVANELLCRGSKYYYQWSTGGANIVTLVYPEFATETKEVENYFARVSANVIGGPTKSEVDESAESVIESVKGKLGSIRDETLVSILCFKKPSNGALTMLLSHQMEAEDVVARAEEWHSFMNKCSLRAALRTLNARRTQEGYKKVDNKGKDLLIRRFTIVDMYRVFFFDDVVMAKRMLQAIAREHVWPMIKVASEKNTKPGYKTELGLLDAFTFWKLVRYLCMKADVEFDEGALNLGRLLRQCDSVMKWHCGNNGASPNTPSCHRLAIEAVYGKRVLPRLLEKVFHHVCSLRHDVLYKDADENNKKLLSYFRMWLKKCPEDVQLSTWNEKLSFAMAYSWEVK